MSTTAFDAGAYKPTTREQWQEAAPAWHAWGPTLEAWLGEATEMMLDQAHVGPGDRVLDLAAGAGGQTIAAARRAGDDGAVLATDLAPDILEFAAAQARSAGLSNVATREMDGEQLDLEHASFDAVISRLGLIYFPNQAGALAETRRVLRPGGRVATIAYSNAGPERLLLDPVSIIRQVAPNGFFSIPVSIIRRWRRCRRRRPACRARSASEPTALCMLGSSRPGSPMWS